ncbi:MAG: bifunctional pyr operon transcriptional regulator/uracil phosphoribosyltransferase PyrR [Clostridia bacterium]|nr:bifunctional pyr operon transcriptional regulator/uracil phosphoribosyltransferase PyrR [Clostridia bacterium]MBQ3938623.1 bifunctional pyr operon transcriptional regulator/uracil phosphoribosyltransferase PyrR [Clostridia bacterium]MBR4636669.1 bifunctional pyr operon transcriptional regulator/uracil phosphoribosyltransferase PyrR [Clostridia bacterium]
MGELKAMLLSEEDVNRILVRMAHQIIEKNHGTDGVCIVGIHTRGVPLARRIAKNIEQITGTAVPVGELDITLHRDDLAANPTKPAAEKRTVIPFSVTGRTVVLVDDVIFTCRTARAAIDTVIALGRPARIQLAALIDRGHAELPIKPNFVGKNIPTALSEVVAVRLAETDGETNVGIYEG